MQQSQNTVAIQFLVSGRVQGVGFRRFVEREANKLALKGWVKNLFSGEVMGLAQGEKATLDQFLAKLKIGPELSKVINLQTKTIQTDNLPSGFHILPDGGRDDSF